MHSSASNLVAVLEADLVSNSWDGAVAPYPGQTSQQYAMMSLRRAIVKKFHNFETDARRDQLALAKFIESNETCKSWSPQSLESDLQAVALGEAKDFIYRFCHPSCEGGDEALLNVTNVTDGLGFGTGACVGAPSGDPYGKLAISSLTYTDPALLVWFQHTWCSLVLQGEQERFRSANYPTNQVQGNKLSFVPKTSEISRTICTEPILNMFFQKGIGAVLEKRLIEVTGIDLSKQQSKNSSLARIGSVTGEFGTIDLSSASDTISRNLVEFLFPPALVGWLNMARSKVTVLPDKSSVELHMVSSMGNAFTFPLQTIIFTALVLGVYRALDLEIRLPRGETVGNFAVYGDDIIVRREAYNLVCKMLSYCGFTVNKDKSFNEGPFRESCGTDWFSGRNVRGVYIQHLKDDMDYYSAYNRLHRWSEANGVSLTRTLDHIRSCVTETLVVPFHEDDEAGFKVPLHDIRHLLSWKRHTQNYEYRCKVRKNVAIKLPYDESELTPKLLRRIRRKVPGWRYCPSGLMLLLLHGSIRNGRVTIRSNEQSPAEYCTRQTDRKSVV